MFNNIRINVSLLLILLLTITMVAPTSAKVAELLLADPFYVVATTPLANALAVDPAAPVEITFNIDLNTSTVTTETLTIHGDQTGFYQGATSYPTGDELEFSPTTGYKPGEKVSVTASSAISSTVGDPLTAHTWQFTAQTGLGSGEYYPHPYTPSFGSGISQAVALGDVDGDMDLDTVIANGGANPAPAYVYANNGSGSFTSLSSFGSSFSRDVKLSDLDNDGDLDAVVANYLDNNLNPLADTVWLNNGTGVFSSHSTPTFGTTASRKLAVSDINGDGSNDVVVVNATDSNLAVWLNSGDGSLAPHPLTPNFGDTSARDVALGDLDLDGDLDAVVANPNEQPQTVWLNDGDGNFTSHPTTPTFGVGDSFGVALGDVDHDGDLDAIIANRGGSTTQAETVWVNDGTGSFSAHPLTPSFGGSFSVGVDLGDIDGDGDLDVVITNDLFYQTVWLNDGTGSYSQPPGKYTFGDGRGSDTALGDIDADGDLDAVSANINAAQLGDANTTWLNRMLDIAISKLASPGSALPTRTISYTLEFSHPEEIIAESFILTDTIPSELTNLQVSASPGLVLDQLPGQPYIWEVDNSTGLTSGTIIITGTIVEGLAAGTTISNEVSIYNPSDVDAANDSAEAGVTVLNAAPELDPIGPQFIYGEEVLTFLASASDLNWDDLTFSLVGEPAGAVIDPTTGIFSWLPQVAQLGHDYQFDVCVSDGIISDCEMITVTVYWQLDISINKNASPDSAIPTGTISYMLEFSHTEDGIAASFLMTDTIPSELTNLQISTTPGLVLNPIAEQPYSWEVDNSTILSSGTITITGTISEGLAAGTTFNNAVSINHPSDINDDNDDAEVAVTVLNAPPVLASIGDQFIAADETLTFTASASDLNWDDLTFSLNGAPAGATINPISGFFSWLPQVSQIGHYQFDICVSDDVTEDCETITVTVFGNRLFLPLIEK